MSKSTAIALLLVGSLATSCYAADVNNERTNGHFNGRFWTGLSDTSKTMFVLGYCDAAGTSDCPKQPTFGDIVKGIDRFYQEPENLRLAIMSAIHVFALKVTGAKASDIEDAMHFARLFADSADPKK